MADAPLKQKIQEEVVAAMRAKDKPRLGALRLISAAIKQKEVDERITLDDAQVLAILDKMLKQRRESVAQFKTAGRDDLIEKELFEIAILQEFLPPALSDDEMAALIDAAIAEAGAESIKDMGKVMAALKPKVQGRADMAQVGAAIKQRLG